MGRLDTLRSSTCSLREPTVGQVRCRISAPSRGLVESGEPRTGRLRNGPPAHGVLNRRKLRLSCRNTDGPPKWADKSVALATMTAPAERMIPTHDLQDESRERDLVWIAHAAVVGDPDGASASRPGKSSCARCARNTSLMTPVGQVISRRFTGYDTWTNLAGRCLCQVCVWAYRHPPLRSTAHVITRTPPRLRAAAPTLLRSVLSAPITTDIAVTIPLHYRASKHLLPVAAWGRVTVDNAQLTWLSADADRLAVMSRLIGAGFTEQEVRRPAPDYHNLKRIPATQWDKVFDEWSQLDPWRSADDWWEVGIRACRS